MSAFSCKKRALLAIAGINVARLGMIAYQEITAITFIHILLSAVVFLLFGMMFYKMSLKHQKRIQGMSQPTRPVWHFFDLKSYLIMAVMMGGGIWLRSSGLAPGVFIAVFYTGLGCALAMAGVLFWLLFIRYKDTSEKQ